MTGTSAVGAAGFALAAFAAGLHVVRTVPVVLWVLGGVGLFVSALTGGLAIRQLSQHGSIGDWQLSHSRPFWALQIWALGIGTALLASGSVVAFSGPARASGERQQDRYIGQLSAELLELRQRQEVLVNEIRQTQTSLRQLSRSVRPSGRRP
jgi:hypothetical protein